MMSTSASSIYNHHVRLFDFRTLTESFRRHSLFADSTANRYRSGICESFI